MHKRPKTLFVIAGIFMCTLSAGCGSGSTAVEVAESYGILKNCDLQPDQVDKMIEDGQAKVRSRVNGLGSGRVLVTEYLIHGDVYRVEVRQPINPLKNIPPLRIRYAESKQGTDENIISWFQLDSVCSALRNQSFQAQAGEVAYRARRGTDGTVYGVIKAGPGSKPEWEPSARPIDLYVRTKEWPVPEMWFRGLTTDGQGSKEAFGSGERWYIMNPGPAGFKSGEAIPFVNLKLYKAITGS